MRNEDTTPERNLMVAILGTYVTDTKAILTCLRSAKTTPTLKLKKYRDLEGLLWMAKHY